MPNFKTISLDYLKSILHYDPETGMFTWLFRPEITKHDAKRNAQYAGRTAGTKAGDYVLVSIDGKNFSAHRLAWLYMTGSMPPHFVDHIDGNPGNNKFSNLREATCRQNCQNRRPRRGTRTGIKGVYPNQHGGFYVLVHDGEKLRHFGTFPTIDQAEAMAVATRNELHGEFARHS